MVAERFVASLAERPRWRRWRYALSSAAGDLAQRELGALRNRAGFQRECTVAVAERSKHQLCNTDPKPSVAVVPERRDKTFAASSAWPSATEHSRGSDLGTKLESDRNDGDLY
jgi:hypothetical protein